jgi:tetratricopeptide (TPR) repeat protein
MTYLYSPDERTATLLVGGDDRVRIWLNGQLVDETAKERRDKHVPVAFRAGRNTLLVKVNQNVGAHFLILRLDDSPLDRAVQMANLGLWDEASALFRREFERIGPWGNPGLWNQSLRLLPLTGRLDEYRREVALPETDSLSRILAPGGTLDPDSEVALADQFVSARASAPFRPPLLCLALYRAGQFDRVIEESRHPNLLSVGLPVIAMAHQRLGHTDEARLWFAKAEARRDVVLKDVHEQGKAGRWDWQTLALFLVLRDEAKALIEGAGQGIDPKLEAMQARSRAWLAGRDKATDAFDRLVESSPKDPHAWLVRARRLGDLGQWAQAEADLIKAIQLNPGDIEILRERNRIWIGLGRADEIAAEYADRLDRATAGPNWDTERSRIALELAEWDEVFTRLTRRRPDDPFLWIGRGRFNALHDRWRESAADYARGVKLRGPSIEWYEYAAVLCLAGDAAGARDFVSWAAEGTGQTDDPYTAFVLARMCGIVRDSPVAPARALRWAEAAAAKGKIPKGLSPQGILLYRAGRYREAIESLEGPEAVEGYLNQKAQNWLVLAMAHFRLKDVATARRWLDRAITSIPTRAGDIPPPNWVGIQLLRREAEALILGTSAQSPPAVDR